jgi:hypothetical protein
MIKFRGNVFIVLLLKIISNLIIVLPTIWLLLWQLYININSIIETTIIIKNLPLVLLVARCLVLALHPQWCQVGGDSVAFLHCVEYAGNWLQIGNVGLVALEWREMEGLGSRSIASTLCTHHEFSKLLFVINWNSILARPFYSDLWGFTCLLTWGRSVGLTDFFLKFILRQTFYFLFYYWLLNYTYMTW